MAKASLAMEALGFEPVWLDICYRPYMSVSIVIEGVLSKPLRIKLKDQKWKCT